MTRPRALIVGGSVGGLFAAGLLRAAGWDAAVFERSSEDLAGRGAGIGTRDALFAAMRRIGIAPDPSVGVAVRSRRCLDRGGAIVHELAVPSLNSAWDRIYRPLKDALPQDCYHAGMRLERFEAQASGVAALFADGTRETGDVLIGADGLASTVRHGLMPEVQPLYAGYVAWRGVLEEGDLPRAIHDALFEHFTFCLPDGELMICLPMPGRDADTRAGSRRFHWVWFRPVEYERALPLLCTDESGRCHGVAIAPTLIRAAVIAELKAHAAEVLAPQVATLVALTERPLLQPIYDLACERIAIGRVALIGDAAFVARPHVGTGVTKAALDAACLADALAAGGDHAAALLAYDRERRALGSALVARARHLGAALEPGPGRRGASQRPEIVLREYGAAGTTADALDAAG